MNKFRGAKFIQSMTGYSRAAKRVANGSVTVELRSTNHRFLEISPRLSDGLADVEGQITQLLRDRLRRGRIEVTVTAHVAQPVVRRVLVDHTLVQAYHERLLELKGRFGFKGSLSLEQILALPRVVEVVEEQAPRQPIWPDARPALERALRELLSMRRAEGRRLAQDIHLQLRRIRTQLRAIKMRLPHNVAQQRQRLRERVKLVVGESAAASPAHLKEAVAVVRDTDIHEELVRLDSHLMHTEQALKADEPVGKKLDFIGQELMREANTMGAKANDPAIVRCVVEIKGAIEKIREQAQNLE